MNNHADDTVVPLHAWGARRRLGKTVGAAFGRLSDRARNAARSTDEFVRVSPWQAAGIVAIVGLGGGLVGARLSGRPRRAHTGPPAGVQGDDL